MIEGRWSSSSISRGMTMMCSRWATLFFGIEVLPGGKSDCEACHFVDSELLEGSDCIFLLEDGFSVIFEFASDHCASHNCTTPERRFVLTCARSKTSRYEEYQRNDV